jgi:transcriptional regulator EpsA
MDVRDASQALAQRPPWSEPSPAPPQPEVLEAGDPERLASLELESLVLNLEGALRVRARHQLFNWTQGALQSLIPHELLVCAQCQDGPALRHVDSFSIAPVEPGHFNELFRHDAFLVPAIFKALEQDQCRPVILDGGSGSPYAGSALARELTRLGVAGILAHGTHDTAGKVSSLYVFACRSGAVGPRHAYLAEWVVPFLHAAWMRARVNWQPQRHGVKTAEAELITVREREVLEWIYRGKSNIEVGMILGISPLTVKNHVQKILRKLDVLNRTQAVGKALALRILDT